MAAAQYSEQTGDAREMAQPLSRSVTILIRRIRRDPRRPCFAVVMLRTRNGYIPIRVVVATGRLHVWMTTAPTRISEDVRSCGIWRMYVSFAGSKCLGIQASPQPQDFRTKIP